MAHRVLHHAAMDSKRRVPERRKASRTTPSPESIHANLGNMADAVRDLQNDVEALINRPKILPWRRKASNADEK